MDGVEGPVAVRPAVGKGLDPEGLGEIGEAGCGAGDAGAGGERRGRKGAGECCSGRGVERIGSEYASCSKQGRNDDLPERPFQSFKQEGSDMYTRSGESENFHISPRSESKKIHRRSIKKLSSNSCSKRFRMDEAENCMGPVIDKCTVSDKSLLRKDMKKIVQDGKKCERKHCRTISKARDLFAWKNGTLNSDLSSGGSKILGVHGKVDSHDCIKDMDEPSLDELLEGSYIRPSLCQTKGKKSSSSNESIILALNKISSILPIQKPTDSSNQEVPVYAQASNNSSATVMETNDGDKVSGESMPSGKTIPDENLRILNQSEINHPSYISERLALPTGEGLGSLLRDLNLISTDSSCIMSAFDDCDVGLSPFSWSVSGSCRLSTDAGKYAINRHSCQGRWARIGSHCIPNGEISSCFPEQSCKADDHMVVSSMDKELDEAFQDAKITAMSCILPLRTHAGPSFEVTDPPETNGQNRSSGICFNHVMKESPSRGKEDGGNLRYNRNGAEATDSSSINFSVQAWGVNTQEDVASEIHGRLKKLANLSCRSGKEENGSSQQSQHMWHLSTNEISDSGPSPRAIEAAHILCEMSKCSEVRWKQNASGKMQPDEKIRWPSLPTQVAPKVRQPKPPIVKMEESLLEARANVTPKYKMSPPQQKSILSDKKSKIHLMKKSSRESLKWSSSVETLYTPKLEKDLVYSKPSYLNPSKQLDLLMPPPRAEKARDESHKGRKDTMALASYTKSFGVKDWNRGRSRRE